MTIQETLLWGWRIRICIKPGVNTLVRTEEPMEIGNVAVATETAGSWANDWFAYGIMIVELEVWNIATGCCYIFLFSLVPFKFDPGS